VRADAAAYLAAEWSRYLVLAGLTAADDAGGAKTVIDRAFASMGVARSDLATASVADADAEGAERLLDKYMVRRLHKALGDLIAMSGGNPNVSLQEQQAWDHLDKMIPTYDAEASAFETIGGNGWQSATSMSFDFLEPDETEAA